LKNIIDAYYLTSFLLSFPLNPLNPREIGISTAYPKTRRIGESVNDSLARNTYPSTMESIPKEKIIQFIFIRYRVFFLFFNYPPYLIGINSPLFII